jgi:hypothetical protein
MATRLHVTLQSWAIFLKISWAQKVNNEILRFRGRFYDGVLNLFPKKSLTSRSCHGY